MPPQLLLDPCRLDLARVVADQEAIRKVNLQRFEMEHLNAIVFLDTVEHVIAGYKDVRDDEFWVRGHLPGHPILPGVIMCEAAAQLASYYCNTQMLMGEGFIGFGGMENVRFRTLVHPGDRLLMIGKATRIHRRQTTWNVQGFVGPVMAFHADVLGVPLQLKGT